MGRDGSALHRVGKVLLYIELLSYTLQPFREAQRLCEASYGDHDTPSQWVVQWKEGEVLLDKVKVNSYEDGNVVQEISVGYILVARGGLLN